MIYKIAEISFVISNVDIKEKGWELFLDEESAHADVEVDLICHKNTGIYNNLELYGEFQTGDKLIRRDEDIMLIRNNWNYARIYPLNNKENLNAFLIQIFYSHAIYQKMFQLHSSLIEYGGKGILFVGPSGIGKTTQAELWSAYIGARIINGDMNFIQEGEYIFWGWGTPWHGTSPYCVNTKVPIHSIVVLQQAENNSIRKLNGFEKVTKVLRNVYYPEWIENGIEMCLEILDHLLRAVPVYELCCRPDEDAVKLTEETIFGRS